MYLARGSGRLQLSLLFGGILSCLWGPRCENRTRVANLVFFSFAKVGWVGRLSMVSAQWTVPEETSSVISAPVMCKRQSTQARSGKNLRKVASASVWGYACTATAKAEMRVNIRLGLLCRHEVRSMHSSRHAQMAGSLCFAH